MRSCRKTTPADAARTTQKNADEPSRPYAEETADAAGVMSPPSEAEPMLYACIGRRRNANKVIRGTANSGSVAGSGTTAGS
jgi:hypothetical protein